MRHRGSSTAVLAPILLALVVSAGPARAEPGTIEEIIPQGLSQMTEEALLWALQIEEGDPYDPERIRRRFRELWKLGLFEDVSIEAEDGPAGGKVLIIKLRERPTLASVTYEDVKEVNKTAIEDRLKEKGSELRLGQPLDMGAIRQAESAIEDLLSEKGFLDAEIRAEIDEVTTTSRSLHFFIDPGGKTRIRKIDFTGNELFGDAKLRSQLELTEERKWWWPWSQKNLYHPVKWDQDVGSVRRIYMDRGYLDVQIGAPIVEVRKSEQAQRQEQEQASRRAASAADAALEELDAAAATPAQAPAGEAEAVDDSSLSPKEAKREAERRAKKERQERKKASTSKGKHWVFLTVPVTEGPQYRLGDVSIEGAKVFPEAILRAQVPLVRDDVLNNGLLEYGVERISRSYEDRGHLYSNVVERIERRPGENVADVTIRVDEDRPYRVGRIDFSGNTATQDRVLRRELAVLEGQMFSRSLLDVSVRKINQLGYWQVDGQPVIEPVAETDEVAITVEGTEQGRNEIQVGGGYSGVDGAFFNGVYSTRNFLGRGQVMSVAMQVGGSSNRYQISFQEPYFLGRPYSFGMSLFRRDADYGQSLRSTSRGWGLQLGKRLKRFGSLTLAYNYEDVESRSFAASITGEQILFVTENKISSVTPLFNHSTINNPYRPTAGRTLNLSMQIAGGPLGGDTSYIKPLFNFVGYSKAFGKFYFGYHAELGFVRAFGDESVVSSSDIEAIPRYQRFWLGGDTLGPRVFETRTITPRRYVLIDDDGNIIDVIGDPRLLSPDDLLTSGGLPAIIEVGGDRMYLFQAELVYPLNQQAELALFYDAGDTLFEDTGLDFETIRISAGIELRFHLPIFPVPLRLIYGIPLRELEADRTSSFTFSIGRSF